MLMLNVPYAEKDEAKALGARWNPKKRSWYVPDGVAIEPFARWSGGAAPSSRQDSRASQAVVGRNVQPWQHDCNPFAPCAHCAQGLAGTPWAKARMELAAILGAWPGRMPAHG